MYTEPADRVTWATAHFWDRFTDTTRVYACDSVTVNGVKLEDLESQMGVFTTLLGQLPLEEGSKAVGRLYDRAEAFERKYPESNVFEELCRLTKHYLYDPNSPVRNGTSITRSSSGWEPPTSSTMVTGWAMSGMPGCAA
jgi:hypothetical protein